MIAISDNPISMYYRKEVLPSWVNHGFKVNHFEAVTPRNMPDFLPFYMKRKQRPFTETEKAVWYSHYALWSKCWETKTPLIVVEHDIRLLSPLEDEIFENRIACLSHDCRPRRPGNEPEELKLAGGAYYITPDISRKLMRIRHDKRINHNSDAWIHKVCDENGKWYKHKCRQFKNPKVGATIEHN